MQLKKQRRKMNVENIKNDANKTVEIQKAKHIFFFRVQHIQSVATEIQSNLSH